MIVLVVVVFMFNKTVVVYTLIYMNPSLTIRIFTANRTFLVRFGGMSDRRVSCFFCLSLAELWLVFW